MLHSSPRPDPTGIGDSVGLQYLGMVSETHGQNQAQTSKTWRNTRMSSK